MKPKLTRSQNNTIISSIAVLVGLLVILQLWLLTATMNAWMGRDDSIVLPAFLASAVFFAFNLYLLRRLNFLAGNDD
jgi:hypothetical protein